MILGFVGVVGLTTALIHLYLWKRLVRDTTRRGPWRRGGGLLMIVLGLLIPVTLIGTRAADADWLAWPGYLWLAVMFYLLVCLLVLEIPLLVARLWLRHARAKTPAIPAGRLGPDPRSSASADPPAPDRRLLLSRSAAIFAGLTATGLTGYGVRTALGPPRIDRVQIPLAKLPRGMDGLRIALVSDIHLGPLRGRAHTARIVDVINQLDADLVAVVGDLVDGTVAELGPAAAPLADLRSRHGSYFVTGNHEYYSGVEDWLQELPRLGLRLLENERLEIATGGGVLDLAGVNDVTGTGRYAPDYQAALAGRDQARPVVLLAHQPVAVREAARHGVDLQLSGHTHGGQMVPFNLLVGLAQPVVSGLGTVDGTKVYVTNGAGFWGPPVRVGAPPQVTLVQLRSP